MEKRSESSRIQRKEYIKRKREICIAFGVCRECMASDAISGIKMCGLCAAKSKERNKKDREWYKLNGICTECKTNSVITGKTICANCSTADVLSYSTRKYNGHKKVGIKKTYMWRERGMCYQCGEPVLEGRVQCKKHYLISKAQADKLNTNNKNHVWRKLSDADVARSNSKTNNKKGLKNEDV